MKKSAIDIYNDLPKELKNSELTISKDNPLKGFESLLNHYGMVSKVEVEYEDEIEDEINWKELISFFNNVTGKKTKVIPEAVKSKFIARIKEGFTKEDIANAIKNCSKDSWHIDTKYKYLTLEFISRPDKLDKYSQIENSINTETTTQVRKYDN